MRRTSETVVSRYSSDDDDEDDDDGSSFSSVSCYRLAGEASEGFLNAYKLPWERVFKRDARGPTFLVPDRN